MHPKWGYDLDQVKVIDCLICQKPIAEEPYTEMTLLARFGQMMFVHKTCEERDKARTPRIKRDDMGI